MNVILVISDTMRRDNLGCYGAPPWAANFKGGLDHIHTPHLDRFAEQCTVFDNAYISSFPTIPTRHDILTGRHTWTFKPWSALDPDTITLQETLNDAGVLTGLVADTLPPFQSGMNYQRGFQTWELIRGQESDPWKASPKDVTFPCDPSKLRNPDGAVTQFLRNVSHLNSEEDYFPAQTFREAARWLESNHTRDPFFLYIDTFAPHEPWYPPRHYTDLYDPGYDGDEVIFPRYDHCNYLTKAELNHCRALYAGEVTLVDHWFGHLLNRAESLDLLKNTAIIFIGDHGFYLGEHGYIGKTLLTPQYQQMLPLYPEVARIPFLIYTPDGHGGRHAKAYAQPVDLMPTICDLLNVQIPGTVQSSSLKPVVEGTARTRKKRDFVICSPTISHPDLDAPHPTTRSSIYDSDWLLVFGPQVHRTRDTETTRMVDSILRRVRALEKGPITPKLYHLPSDPDCKRNVMRANRDVASELHAKYVAFLETAGVPERHLQFFREL